MKTSFTIMALLVAHLTWAQTTDSLGKAGISYDKLSAWQRNTYTPNQTTQSTPTQGRQQVQNQSLPKFSLKYYGTRGYWRLPLAYTTIETADNSYPFRYPVAKPKEYYLYPASSTLYTNYSDPYSFLIAGGSNLILNKLFK